MLARGGVGGAAAGPRRPGTRLGISWNDSADRNMIALSELAFDLAPLPTEDPGTTALAAPNREEVWVRRLFEKAVLGFARVELEICSLARPRQRLPELAGVNLLRRRFQGYFREW